MTAMQWVGAVAALGLFVYLVAALIDAENL